MQGECQRGSRARVEYVRARLVTHAVAVLEEGQMSDACEHWLVQRRVNDRYWACVDCELEFRPVETKPVTPNDIVRRALLRVGLGEA